jgi:hypothetical protein
MIFPVQTRNLQQYIKITYCWKRWSITITITTIISHVTSITQKRWMITTNYTIQEMSGTTVCQGKLGSQPDSLLYKWSLNTFIRSLIIRMLDLSVSWLNIKFFFTLHSSSFKEGKSQLWRWISPDICIYKTSAYFTF